jgi:hypothetical protein
MAGPQPALNKPQGSNTCTSGDAPGPEWQPWGVLAPQNL